MFKQLIKMGMVILLAFMAVSVMAAPSILAQTETPAMSPTPEATADPLPAVLELARTPVLHNADWTPVTHTFDGVEMVLVPAGCFEMGNDPEAYYYWDDRKTILQGVPSGGQQCFEEPFWLDKTEVTNAQFDQFNGQAADSSYWTDTNRPRESITWFEARDFCARREARLPTEAEWEYAARGPDALFFPWGSDFVPDNVVYNANSGNQTASVGSKLGGLSWVGALDLSGSVWEWMSSAYESYPYDVADGREDVGRIFVLYVLRGGSWGNAYTDDLRAAARAGYDPENRDYVLGFRCALSAFITESVVVSPTPTPTATATPVDARLEAALELARTPVAHNADWTPVTHTFEGVEMVLVPAGCFEMGNDSEPYYYDEKTNSYMQGVPSGGQQCFNEPFWLDKYEVTNAQYKQCVDAGVCTPPGDRTDYDDATYADHPVVYVDWTQAQTYAKWRGGRLPTEREWEYAARGPDALFFPWGNDFLPDNVVYSENSGGRSAHVGSKPGGVSWVGALDLIGNVWEWTNSAYVAYPYDKDDWREDVGRVDGLVVIRGGAFNSVQIFSRAAFRGDFQPFNRLKISGFRLVVHLPSP